jgi:hypothetical protein
MNPMEDGGILDAINPEPAFTLFRSFHYSEHGKGDEENHGQWETTEEEAWTTTQD